MQAANYGSAHGVRKGRGNITCTMRKRLYLKEWRVASGLTQEQLASRLETTAATISRYETGKQALAVDNLDDIAKAIRDDLDPVDLYRHPNQPESRMMRLIRTMAPERQEQALRVLEALAGRAA